jgi:hypothetical protein
MIERLAEVKGLCRYRGAQDRGSRSASPCSRTGAEPASPVLMVERARLLPHDNSLCRKGAVSHDHIIVGQDGHASLKALRFI